MWRRSLLGGIIGATLAGAALADPLVPADPWEVIHMARELGLAEVDRDSLGDPRITGEIEGLAYQVDFYGCWLGRECDSILLQVRLAKDDWKPDPDEIAAWNARKLFGRAWIEDEDVAVLDHAVAMGQGLPKDVLKASFDAWQTAVVEFAEDIDFK